MAFRSNVSVTPDSGEQRFGVSTYLQACPAHSAESARSLCSPAQWSQSGIQIRWPFHPIHWRYHTSACVFISQRPRTRMRSIRRSKASLVPPEEQQQAGCKESNSALTVPPSTTSKPARASAPSIRAMSCIRCLVSRVLVDFERNWESLARRQGWRETRTLGGSEDEAAAMLTGLREGRKHYAI